MPSASSVFEFYNPYSTKNTHTTQASITMPQMVNGSSPPPIITLYSSKVPVAGYYGFSDTMYTVTYSVAGAFIGTCLVQYSNTPMPGEVDWITIDESRKSYIGLETTGGAGISGGFSSAISHPVQTDFVSFIGQYSWMRVKLDISQGTLLSARVKF